MPDMLVTLLVSKAVDWSKSLASMNILLIPLTLLVSKEVG